MNFTLQAQIGVLFSRKSNICEVLKNLDIFLCHKTKVREKQKVFFSILIYLL